ncbi:MAG: NUDIX hydrolase, partial [Desulfobacterales bacterium]|nr:NUDIX hydrolase [Desulfobacterales bacterium]
VMVIKEGKVLLGRRKGGHGTGTWAFPGGHLEFGESIEACAKREVMEETGLEVDNIRHQAFTNDIFTREDKHYATLFVRADYTSGKAVVMEPDKCEQWAWFDWGQFPEPLFLSLENLLKQGFRPD